MSTRHFSLPLSRWHHVADRIRQIGDSKSNEAFAVLATTQLGTPIDAEQSLALKERGKKALSNIELARQAVTVVGTIRDELAKANAAYGINSLLSQAESKRREAQLLRRFGNIDLVTKVPLDQSNSVLASQQKEREVYTRASVNVALVSAQSLAGFSDLASALDSQAAAINDQVAELNRNKLSIELPVDLAKAAGLGD